MAATVLLDDVIEALDIVFDEMSSFLDLDTGKVETVSNDLLSEAEESPDDEPGLSDWQKEEWEIAKRIASTDRFKQLPTKFDVHEWQILQDFSRSVQSERIREDLQGAIHRAGAFRNFKNLVIQHGIESEWYAFRAAALRQIAIDWCEENQIAWR